MDTKELARFLAKVEKQEDGCWQWVGAITCKGYGNFHLGRMRSAHRVSYEHYVGPIPDGRELDHQCQNKACVNPKHLEAVTHSLNMKRAPLANRSVTRCPQGHPYDEENTRYFRGTDRSHAHRRCHACESAYQRAYYVRRKARALEAIA